MKSTKTRATKPRPTAQQTADRHIANDRRRLFVEYYLSDATLNAARAARRAGYARDTAHKEGSRLLARPDVRAAIDARLAEVALSTNEILYRLGEQARGTLEPFLYGQEGDEADDPELAPSALLDLKTEAARANVHLLKEVTQERIDLGDNLVKTTTKIKIHDSQAALVHLGRAAGLFKEKQFSLLALIDISRLPTEYLNRISAGEDPNEVLMSAFYESPLLQLPVAPDAQPERASAPGA